MYEALFGSMGAALISLFHQFAGGKRGSGSGKTPPRWGDCAVAAAATPMRIARKAKRGMNRLFAGRRQSGVPPVTAATLFQNEIALRYNIRQFK
jgi:hypothetical protein